jgi:putative hemolysin
LGVGFVGGSVPQIIIIAACLLGSAFFSMSETSLTMFSRVRLRNMLDEGEKGAKSIDKATRDHGKLLGTILVGVNFANIVLTTVVTALAIHLWGDSNIVLVIVTVVLTLIVLIFCDIFPKTLAAGNPKRYSRLTAPLINLFIMLFTPLVFLLNAVVAGPLKLFAGKDANDVSLTESEIKTIVDIGQEEGVIEDEEHRLISSVFEFNDLRAKDIMIPRTDMVAVPIDAGYGEVIGVFRQEKFICIPVYRENEDDIVGILYLEDLFFLDEQGREGDFIERNMRTPWFSYENKPLNELFREMRLNNADISIIVDEYGGTSGILTFSDLINEIAGDLPTDEDEEITKINENEYVVAGDARLDDVNEVLDIALESDDCETIGGYVLGLLDDMPEQGTEAAEDGVRFVVEEMEKNRILKIKINKSKVKRNEG